LMRSVVCCVLVTSRFQSPPLGSPAMGEKKVHQSSLPVHSLSVDKPFVEPPSWRCMVTEHLTTSDLIYMVLGGGLSHRHVACQAHRRVDLPWCPWTGPQLWINSAAALLKERLRESTLTENYLVLPGQVLQPEATDGVTLTENLESWIQRYWAIRRSLTDHSTMHKPQLLHGKQTLIQ